MHHVNRPVPLQRRWARVLCLLSCLLVGWQLTGCAARPTADGALSSPQMTDPFEAINRKIFVFNSMFDRSVMRPAAHVYHAVVPNVIDNGVGRMLSNLEDVNHIANDVLQGEWVWAAQDFWRVVINSTLGLGGFFDVASHSDLPRHEQDFGLTLATWGWKDSRYVVLPFLGPSTFRDGVALPMDYGVLSVYNQMPHRATNQALATMALHRRANLLRVDKVMDQAFDPYVFVRNAYTQRRLAAIRSLHFTALYRYLAD